MTIQSPWVCSVIDRPVLSFINGFSLYKRLSFQTFLFHVCNMVREGLHRFHYWWFKYLYLEFQKVLIKGYIAVISDWENLNILFLRGQWHRGVRLGLHMSWHRGFRQGLYYDIWCRLKKISFSKKFSLLLIRISPQNEAMFEKNVTSANQLTNGFWNGLVFAKTIAGS